MPNRRLVLVIVISVVAASFFVSGLLPQRGISLPFYVNLLCGIGFLVIGLRSGRRDPLRVTGLVVGIGALIVALSLFKHPWLGIPWLTFVGATLMFGGGLKSYNAFVKNRRKFDSK